MFSFIIRAEGKRQKSVPEDLSKGEDDRSSLSELDFCRTFEEEVGPASLQIALVSMASSCLAASLSLDLAFLKFRPKEFSELATQLN